MGKSMPDFIHDSITSMKSTFYSKEITIYGRNCKLKMKYFSKNL
jgi:hypothetical protein